LGLKGSLLSQTERQGLGLAAAKRLTEALTETMGFESKKASRAKVKFSVNLPILKA
jgi:hypothetical protein